MQDTHGQCASMAVKCRQWQWNTFAEFSSSLELYRVVTPNKPAVPAVATAILNQTCHGSPVATSGPETLPTPGPGPNIPMF